MKWATFDLETDTIELDDISQVGVTCASLHTENWQKLWFNRAGRISDTREIIQDLAAISEDYKIVTWNGLQFDFRVLYHQTQYNWARNVVQSLAMDHYDPMFQFLCHYGWPIGLDATCRGMNLPGKPEGMHGDLAPAMWNGTREEQDKVLSYVSLDTEILFNVVKKIDEESWVQWITKSGKRSEKRMKMMPVEDCLSIPYPDTSWMDSPISRESFYDWIKVETRTVRD